MIQGQGFWLTTPVSTQGYQSRGASRAVALPGFLQPERRTGGSQPWGRLEVLPLPVRLARCLGSSSINTVAVVQTSKYVECVSLRIAYVYTCTLGDCGCTHVYLSVQTCFCVGRYGNLDAWVSQMWRIYVHVLGKVLCMLRVLSKYL